MKLKTKKNLKPKSDDFEVGSVVTLKNDSKNRSYKIVSIDKDGTYHFMREDGVKFHGTKKDVAVKKNKTSKKSSFNPTEIIESGKLPDGLSEQKLRIIQKQARQMRKYDIEQAAQDKLDEIKSENYKKKMQKIIDKLIDNSAKTFEELKTKIIENPTITVESDKGKINFLFIHFKGINEIKRLYMYSNNKLIPCRVKQFIKKVEIGEYKIIYEVA